MGILIVEDERRFANLLADELRGLNHKVSLVFNGERALEELKKTSYDVVLSDIRMTPIDGIELLKRVKSRWPEIEVVMMTAYASVETAVGALRFGA
ncbi:MAG TPA: response regulator, partial [bacterium (Candidatus Stahlbacteria)]|nr:response regulator [Candidatus Stahlbacteria bacterium]